MFNGESSKGIYIRDYILDSHQFVYECRRKRKIEKNIEKKTLQKKKMLSNSLAVLEGNSEKITTGMSTVLSARASATVSVSSCTYLSAPSYQG